MTTRVYLHIGSPKTGTTYLQSVLFQNRSRLRSAGVLYPGDTADAHFRATLDLRGLAFGGYDDPAVIGAWPHLLGRIRDWSGDAVVVSHELLAGSRPETIDALLADLDATEVHVLLTARDLGRQVPAVWQEMVKNGQTLSYPKYLAQVTGARQGRGARVFWRQQDTAEVLARWSRPLGPERVHLVTVPPPGAAPTLLWERFASVVGLEPADYDAEVPRTNVSLGLAEAELVRQVNAALGDRLDWPDFAAVVKGGLAERLLAARGDTDRAQVPTEQRAWFDQTAEQMVDDVRKGGYDVVGDLEELRPWYGDGGGAKSPTRAAVNDAATWALAELLAQQVKRRRSTGRRLAARASGRLSGRWRRTARRLLP